MTADRLVGTVVVAGAFVLYLLPLLVAAHHDALRLRRVVLINVLLGWTVVGWVYCLLISRRRPHGHGATAPDAASPWRDPSLQDRTPSWVAELARAERGWSALPRDTAPYPFDRDPEKT